MSFVPIQLQSLQAPKVMVCSYPRSGTHFLCYAMRYLSHSMPAKSRLKIERCHSFLRYYEVQKQKNEQPSIDPNKDYLVLILRNYRECMLRSFLGDSEKVLQHLVDDSSSHLIYRYFNNLEDFDNWPPHKRHLVYYEDLMQNPMEELLKIANFLKIDKRRVLEFVKNIDFHREECLKRYNREFKASDYRHTQSKGLDMLYHSKKIPLDERIKMDILAKQRSPYLYKKYLKRYELAEGNSKSLK